MASAIFGPTNDPVGGDTNSTGSDYESVSSVAEIPLLNHTLRAKTIDLYIVLRLPANNGDISNSLHLVSSNPKWIFLNWFMLLQIRV